MSLPLKDVRSSIPELTDSLLDAHASARDITKSELIREILSIWTDRELTIFRKLEAELQRSGLNSHGEPVVRR